MRNRGSRGRDGIERLSRESPAGIDSRDLRIADMARRENAQPGEVRSSLLAAINRKRLVGSVGTSKNVAIGQIADFFHWKEEDERVVSVHLSHDVNYTTVANPLQTSRATAIVQYGGGGGINEVEVDVKRGCSFSLCAGFVAVRIRNDGVAGAPFTASEMPLRAWLTDRAVANPVPCTKTLYRSALAAAGALVVGVPAAAAKVRIYREPVAAPFTFNMMNFGLAERVEVNVPTLVTPDMLELPGDCSAVEVVNGATPITRLTFVFELSL